MKKMNKEVGNQHQGKDNNEYKGEHNDNYSEEMRIRVRIRSMSEENQYEGGKEYKDETGI